MKDYSKMTMKQIEDLFLSNERMILESLEKAEKRKQKAAGIERMDRAKEGECCKRIVEAFCAMYYPPFAATCGGEMPEIHAMNGTTGIFNVGRSLPIAKNGNPL